MYNLLRLLDVLFIFTGDAGDGISCARSAAGMFAAICGIGVLPVSLCGKDLELRLVNGSPS